MVSAMFTKEMQKALEADGGKLRDLTGQDHGPQFVEEGPFWDACPECNGCGNWEQPCPQPDDPYFTQTFMCAECGGCGHIEVAEPPQIGMHERDDDEG